MLRTTPLMCFVALQKYGPQTAKQLAVLMQAAAPGVREALYRGVEQSTFLKSPSGSIGPVLFYVREDALKFQEFQRHYGETGAQLRTDSLPKLRAGYALPTRPRLVEYPVLYGPITISEVERLRGHRVRGATDTLDRAVARGTLGELDLGYPHPLTKLYFVEDEGIPSIESQAQIIDRLRAYMSSVFLLKVNH